MFGALGERLGIDVLGRGMTSDTATDESLLRALAERSRGGADAVFGARRGVVDSGAVFGWVRRLLPDGRWRLAPEPLLAQLAEAKPAAPQPLQLIAHRQLGTMNSQLRELADTAVMVAPRHAAELGGDGARVEVRAADRAVSGIVRGDERIPEGVVAIPHGWPAPNVSGPHQCRCRHRPAHGDGQAVSHPGRDPTRSPVAGKGSANRFES